MTVDITKIADKLLLELTNERVMLMERAKGVRLFLDAIIKESERQASESSESKTNN